MEWLPGRLIIAKTHVAEVLHLCAKPSFDTELRTKCKARLRVYAIEKVWGIPLSWDFAILNNPLPYEEQNMDFLKLRKIKWKHILLLVLLLLVIFILVQYLTLPDVTYLQKENPKTTALIEKRKKEYIRKGEKPKEYRIWVPYNQVSDYLKKAILVGEDINFFSHKGIDYEEIKESIKIDWKKKKFVRGASTITQQLVRNLYLSTSKNPLRKIKEILIAFRLEKALSKTRIFELYLNLVEWGEGIYGCEAASRAYFGKSCSDLTPDEAIRMSTSLPFPRKYPPISTAKRFERRRKIIYNRMLKYGFIPKEEEKVPDSGSTEVKLPADTVHFDSIGK